MFGKFSRLAAVLAVLAIAGQGMAAPPKSAKDQMVATLNAAAQKAFDAGDFARAADIYLDLWRQDGAQPLYLYNAARASHLGGQLDRAEDLYKQLLALPGLDQARLDKSRGYLVEVKRRRGERKAEEAARLESDGKYEASAALWRDAFDLDPGRHAWLVRAGRALHLAGKKMEALEVYKKYLEMAPQNAPERADVQRWTAELKPASAAAPAAPAEVKPGPNGAAEVKAGPNAPTEGKAGPQPGGGVANAGDGRQPAVTATLPAGGVPTTAWIALGAGVAAIAGGVVVYLKAASDADTLQKDLDAAKRTVDGQTVYLLNHSDVTTRNDAIARDKSLGVVLGGVGVIGAGVGAWLLLTAPRSRVVMLPAPDLGGVRLAFQF